MGDFFFFGKKKKKIKKSKVQFELGILLAIFLPMDRLMVGIQCAHQAAPTAGAIPITHTVANDLCQTFHLIIGVYYICGSNVYIPTLYEDLQNSKV